MTDAALTASTDPGHRSRTVFILSTMALSIVVLAFDAWRNPGWIGATVWSVGFVVVFGVGAAVRRDTTLGRFLLLAVSAGFAELAADAWLVDATGTLVYPANEPTLFASPAYMPFSWAVVLVPVGYIGWLIGRHFQAKAAAAGAVNRWLPWAKAGLAVAVLGGLLVPFYEFLAIHAEWWSYRDAPLIFGVVPAYIMLAEALLMLAVPLLFHFATRVPVAAIVLLGLAEGAVMWLACLIAYPLLG